MRISSTLSSVALLASLLAVPGAALAQSSNAGTPPKTIGSTAKNQMVPSLIVMNAKGVTLDGQKLTLLGVSQNAIVFADRPVRSAGHALTQHLLEEWTQGTEDSFGKDPPNATVSALSKDASTVHDAVVVLKSPKMDGDQLTFDVDVLEGSLTGAEGPAAVFIDIIGMPRTPLSFAGAARRTAYRTAWYAGAAAPYYYPHYYPPPYPYSPY